MSTKIKFKETAYEYLTRMVSNLSLEEESYLDDLPTTQAVIEYFELWSAYDTDFISGIHECLLDNANPKVYNDFIDDWQLPWKKFINGNFQ